ncbi:MAG: bifunctional diaminohydroxyphosphoribosylaminopyrimidine deaminase/5-amino-6-(5-phosphoribosylamino)uracil reductase RibD [Acuticoccus sp.]
MAAALAVGRHGQGQTAPNPAVGAVLVQAGPAGPAGPVIVGAGSTAVGGRPHAERLALAQAGDRAAGATCYSTLEPCSHFGRTSPCADALIAAGVAAVVIGVEDPNPAVAGQGTARLRAAGIAVRLGVRADEAAYDLRGHISRMTRRRPFVALKLAVSADGGIGRTAMAPGAGQIAITGPASRARAHLLRAEHDAIAVGVGTLVADNPRLTCRLPGLLGRSPVRVVLDSAARTPPDAALFADAQVPVIVVVDEGADPDRRAALAARGADIIAVPRRAAGLDLAATLNTLAERGIGTVLAEGGAALAEALAAADLVDEAHIIRSDVRLGEGAIRPFAGDPVAALRNPLRVTDRRLVGADTWTHLKRPCLPE